MLLCVLAHMCYLFHAISNVLMTAAVRSKRNKIREKCIGYLYSHSIYIHEKDKYLMIPC